MILEPREDIEEITTEFNLEPRNSEDLEELTTLKVQPRNSAQDELEMTTQFYTEPRNSELDLLAEFSAEDLQMDFNPDEEMTTISNSPK